MWVCRRQPNRCWGGYLRLFWHTMRDDMIFRGYQETVMNHGRAHRDMRLPRIVVGPLSPPGASAIAAIFYGGKPLNFCTFVDRGMKRASPRSTIKDLGLDPSHFTAGQLAKVGYSTFWTGNRKWPFIVC